MSAQAQSCQSDFDGFEAQARLGEDQGPPNDGQEVYQQVENTDGDAGGVAFSRGSRCATGG